MTDFFTSDTHFNHTNIIKYCSRPFASAEEMNAALIAKWNAIVSPDDRVWHLGDFSLGGYDGLPEIFAALNGEKHLIAGNHDGSKVKNLPWTSKAAFWWLPGLAQRTMLIHNPGLVKPTAAPCLVLHGHLHGMSDYHPFKKHPHVIYLDVGVDCWDYSPITIEQINSRLNAPA